ncbi:UNVERIFIED_CONTAM: hypothetical protein Sangu_3041100 [Sesamum angustifolium]|uniref:Uncharacterized protein n=1 Tax=Sesamum angustifolium TaxID=2727405 RepID=A0AAW2KF47_9LAMI
MAVLVKYREACCVGLSRVQRLPPRVQSSDVARMGPNLSVEDLATVNGKNQ